MFRNFKVPLVLWHFEISTCHMFKLSKQHNDQHFEILCCSYLMCLICHKFILSEIRNVKHSEVRNCEMSTVWTFNNADVQKHTHTQQQTAHNTTSFPKLSLLWRGPGGVGKGPLIPGLIRSRCRGSKNPMFYRSIWTWPSTTLRKVNNLRELL